MSELFDQSAKRRGQRRQQLDMALSRVKDEATRDALSALSTFVLDLVKSAAFDGNVQAMSFATGDGGSWKVKVVEGRAAARSGTVDRQVIKVPGRVLGVFGVTQNSGLEKWNVMGELDPGAGIDQCYFERGATENGPNAITIRNRDTVNRNYFKVVMFYKEDN